MSHNAGGHQTAWICVNSEVTSGFSFVLDFMNYEISSCFMGFFFFFFNR